MPDTSRTRREFLTGKAALERFQEGLELPIAAPSSGPTLRLTQRAMACDFSVIMNGGVPANRVRDASDALDLVSELESQMSVYQSDSELSELNRGAHQVAMEVEPNLFQLLTQCRSLHDETDGCFDPTSGPLVALWRACREEGRIPAQEEVDERLKIVGMQHVVLDESRCTVLLDASGVELNLGGIGKGHALDRVAQLLAERDLHECLLHGGYSSVLARGTHHGTGGWPVGVGNPLFTRQRLGTIILRDRALSTSGSNIQYFSHRGRRFGHILDPRTGWPVETMLSVTVLAATAAEADALSTALYVMGVEKATKWCDNLGSGQGIGAVLIPLPESGRKLSPIVRGIPADDIYWDDSQISV
jgi:thiamine biosynthesis lipoprotein